MPENLNIGFRTFLFSDKIVRQEWVFHKPQAVLLRIPVFPVFSFLFGIFQFSLYICDKFFLQFAQLFLDLQKKCENAEISEKALDLRGLLDALRLIRRGVGANRALDMGITNKAFDSYEQSLIRDVIAARIPAKLDRSRLFTD